MTLAPGTVIDGRYRIVRFLNQGGAGVVHEVEHLLVAEGIEPVRFEDRVEAQRLGSVVIGAGNVGCTLTRTFTAKSVVRFEA